MSRNDHRQPTPTEVAEVRDAFRADDLVRVCEADDFSRYAERVDLGSGRFYWHRSTGAEVLAVAHLDTVQADRSCRVTETAAGLLATSGGLDDRLGAYVILDMLPALGVEVDILLTTDEEVGRSTATEYAATVGDDHGYNWAIEFDRGGTDVVLYQYETPELVDLVREAGARVGVGSYSDISTLEPLGISCLNWGVGYQDYHSPRGHAWLEDTFRMVARFLRFYDANRDLYLPFTPRGPFPDDDDYNLWDGELEADCGHLVDLYDPASYVEWQSGGITCTDCAPFA